MLISEYAKQYTTGDGIFLRDVYGEFSELLIEILKLNYLGITEEFGDFFHFLQLWIYFQFKIDGEIWSITKNSVNKFMDRKEIWKAIYRYVGLEENISNYVGNYQRLDKVIKHLSNFNITTRDAYSAYNIIVRKRIHKRCHNLNKSIHF